LTIAAKRQADREPSWSSRAMISAKSAAWRSVLAALAAAGGRDIPAGACLRIYSVLP
jgi:hypothetical protein